MAQTLWRYINGEGATEWVPASADFPLPVEVTAGGTADSPLTLTSSEHTSAGAANIAAGAKSVNIFVESGTATIDGVDYDGPGNWIAEAPEGYVLPAVTVTVAAASVVKKVVFTP